MAMETSFFLALAREKERRFHRHLRKRYLFVRFVR